MINILKLTGELRGTGCPVLYFVCFPTKISECFIYISHMSLFQLSDDSFLQLAQFSNSVMTKASMSWISCQCQALFSIIRITLAVLCGANRGGTVIVDMLYILTQEYKREAQQHAREALWSVWALELWSSRANQRKTKAHNSRGLHSCWSAFNANRAYFHTPLIAWIDCLLNS